MDPKTRYNPTCSQTNYERTRECQDGVYQARVEEAITPKTKRPQSKRIKNTIRGVIILCILQHISCIRVMAESPNTIVNGPGITQFPGASKNGHALQFTGDPTWSYTQMSTFISSDGLSSNPNVLKVFDRQANLKAKSAPAANTDQVYGLINKNVGGLWKIITFNYAGTKQYTEYQLTLNTGVYTLTTLSTYPLTQWLFRISCHASSNILYIGGYTQLLRHDISTRTTTHNVKPTGGNDETSHVSLSSSLNRLVFTTGAAPNIYILDPTNLSTTKTFSKHPSVVYTHGLLNNLNQNQFYESNADTNYWLADHECWDLTVASGPGSKLFPQLRRSPPDNNNMLNFGTFTYLGVVVDNANIFLVINKINFTEVYPSMFKLYGAIDYWDWSLAGNQDGGEFDVVAGKAWLSINTWPNNNFQVYYFQLDQCDSFKIESPERCKGCEAGYYLHVLVSDTVCLSPAEFPAKHGISSVTGTVVACQTGCLTCLADYMVCTACDTVAGYYLNTADGLCIHINDMPSGKGANLGNGQVSLCQDTDCIQCKANRSSCSQCANPKLSYIGGCISSSSIPAGFGLTPIPGQLAACPAGCLQCAFSVSVCVLCDTANGWALIDNTCYTPLMAPSPYGPDPTTGSTKYCSQGCLACATSYLICDLCDVPNGFYLFAGTQCIKSVIELPRQGLDVSTNSFKECQVANCKKCQADYRTCTECTAGGFVLANNQCTQSCQGPQCDLQLKYAEFQGKRQRITVVFAEKIEDIELNFLKIVLSQANQPSITCSQSICNLEMMLDGQGFYITIKIDTDILDAKMHITLESPSQHIIQTESRSKAFQAYPIEILHIYRVSESSSTVGVLASGISKTTSIAKPILSVLYPIFSPGLSGALDYMMSTFSYITNLNGPFLMYPQYVLALFNTASYLPESWPSVFSYVWDEEQTPAKGNFGKNGLLTNIFENFGNDIILIYCLLLLCGSLALAAYLYLQKYWKKEVSWKIHLNELGTNDPFRVKAMKFLNSSFGITFLFSKMDSVMMEVVGYSMISLCSNIDSPSKFGSFVASVLFLAYYGWHTYALYRLAKEVKIKAKQLVESKAPETIHPPAIIRKASLMSSQSYLVKAMTFQFDDMKVEALVNNEYWVYMPVFSCVRCLAINYFGYNMADMGIIQNVFTTLVEVAYLVVTIKARVKYSLAQNTVSILLASCYSLYNLLKIASYIPMDQWTLQYVVGMASMGVVGMIILVNILSVLIIPFIVLSSFIKSRNSGERQRIAKLYEVWGNEKGSAAESGSSTNQVLPVRNPPLKKDSLFGSEDGENQEPKGKMQILKGKTELKEQSEKKIVVRQDKFAKLDENERINLGTPGRTPKISTGRNTFFKRTIKQIPNKMHGRSDQKPDGQEMQEIGNQK